MSSDRVIDVDEAGEVLMLAWGLIANAYEGDWNQATDEWRNAALDYRDNHWHPWLDKYTPAK